MSKKSKKSKKDKLPPAIEAFMKELEEEKKRMEKATAGFDNLKSRKETLERHLIEQQKELGNIIDQSEK